MVFGDRLLGSYLRIYKLAYFSTTRGRRSESGLLEFAKETKASFESLIGRAHYVHSANAAATPAPSSQPLLCVMLAPGPG